MLQHRCLILLTLHAGVSLAQMNNALPLTMLVEDRPPLIELSSNHLQGTMGIRAEAILRASTIRFQYAHASIDTQLTRVREGREAVCAVGRVRTAERTSQGQFSAPFFASATYVALVRSDAQWIVGAPMLKDWAQNPKLRWGIKAGYFYDNYINAALQSAKAMKIPFSLDNSEADHLLLRNTIDFVLMHQEEIQLLLVSRPSIGSNIMSVRLHDLLEGEFRYFYCSRKVQPAIMEQLNRSIRQIQQARG